jgi:type VI secretion system protein ImpF
MARQPARDVLRPSLLDRIIGGERTHAHRVGIGFRELRDAVARDLEWLLNTRVLVLEEWRAHEEASRSVLTYGVPDFATASWINRNDPAMMARLIADAIRTFEPRLIDRTVKVDVQPRQEDDPFRMRFRITAELYVEPVREAVAFDTDMDTKDGGFQVIGSF